MRGLTRKEGIEYCKATRRLRVSRDGIRIGFAKGPRRALVLRTPPHVRSASALCSDIVNFQEADRGGFEGGLLLLDLWDVGQPAVNRVGWGMLEAVRRTRGISASLEIAPATVFRADELIEEQAFLTCALAFGWGGYLVPNCSPFLLDLRTSDRFFIYAEAAEVLDEIEAVLKPWKPVRVDEASETRGSGRRKPKPLAPRKRKRR